MTHCFYYDACVRQPESTIEQVIAERRAFDRILSEFQSAPETKDLDTSHLPFLHDPRHCVGRVDFLNQAFTIFKQETGIDRRYEECSSIQNERGKAVLLTTLTGKCTTLRKEYEKVYRPEMAKIEGDSSRTPQEKETAYVALNQSWEHFQDLLVFSEYVTNFDFRPHL